MIELDNVSVRVPPAPPDAAELTLLAPTTLQLTERRVALIGANGSGKTTLARLLNGLTRATAGRVLVDGLDPATQGQQVRRLVGFSFADPDTQLVMPTPVEDVALSLRERVPRRQRREAAREVLAQVGLAHTADRPVSSLSGGEKQLVALASVLAVNPQIVVCDEPTTRLDLRWRNRVLELLGGLPQRLVMVTHDLDAVRDWPRVLLLDGGRLVADGPGERTVGTYLDLVGGRP